jgi:ketosteroid isomerase-like protein
LNLLTDDVVWWVQGEWPMDNFHRGKSAVEGLFDLLKTLLVGTLEVEFGFATAQDDRVALEMRSNGLLKNGKHYRNGYHYLFTVKDGRIASCKEYLDTKHLAEVVFS